MLAISLLIKIPLSSEYSEYSIYIKSYFRTSVFLTYTSVQYMYSIYINMYRQQSPETLSPYLSPSKERQEVLEHQGSGSVAFQLPGPGVISKGKMPAIANMGYHGDRIGMYTDICIYIYTYNNIGSSSFPPASLPSWSRFRDGSCSQSRSHRVKQPQHPPHGPVIQKCLRKDRV